MKNFVLGVAIGALVCFGILRAKSPPAPENPAPAPPSSASALSNVCSDVASMPLANAVRTASSDIEERPSSTVIETAPAVAVPTVASEVGPDWIANLSERQAGEICTRAHQLRQQREQAAKDAEPKDAGWAYSMEQLMRQHIEMHMPADKYTKLRVECRTTFCELRMEGASADGQNLADQIVQQIQHQDWSDVVQKGSGGGSDGAAWYVDYDWFRPGTDEERRVWFDIRKQREPEEVVVH